MTTTTTNEGAAVVAARRLAKAFAEHGGTPLYAVACNHLRAAMVAGWVLMFEAQENTHYGADVAHALAELLERAADQIEVKLVRSDVPLHPAHASKSGALS